MTLLKLILLLMVMETGGHKNPNYAVGDNGRAVGCLQIHPISVRQANKLSGYERFTLKDRHSRSKSVEMAYLICLWRKRQGYSYEDIGVLWNTGNPHTDNPKYRRKLRWLMKS